jgi:2-hydroxy-3-keto-5-methylthiopentenyl-1-phosphate phosphatase
MNTRPATHGVIHASKESGIDMSTNGAAPGHYLIASDFDQTLSFNDSGLVLSELIGVPNFRDKVAGLSDIHLVQQGAELTYLLRHDPEFRCVRREHLIETGKQVRLKKDIKRFVTSLEAGADDYRFSFYVISAAPRTVVESALEGIVPPDHIYGAECAYDATSGEICAVTQVPAGYGKVAILEALASRLQISPDRTVYVGDGSSDVHVMLHVNSGNGFTIAVSEAKHITRIARRTVISDNALSVLVPILEDVVGWEAARIRQLFASKGLALQQWDKARTDWVTLRPYSDVGTR